MRTWTALIVGCLLAVSCGGGDSAAEPTEDALRATASDYFEAFVDGNGKEVAELTDPACDLTIADASGAILLASAFLEGFSGVTIDELEYEITAVSVDETTGAVDTMVSVDGEPFDDEGDSTEWVFVDGEGWHAVDCLDMSFDTDE